MTTSCDSTCHPLQCILDKPQRHNPVIAKSYWRWAVFSTVSAILTLWRPLLPYGYSYKASWASECPDVKNYKWRLNPVWHRIRTHMATVGVKGLTTTSTQYHHEPIDLGIRSRLYDQRRRHHCLSVVHGCQRSTIELFQSPLLESGTLCRASHVRTISDSFL